MWPYLLKRLLAIIPTLLGITVVCFFIINLAPGGPVERKMAQMKFAGAFSTGGGGGGGDSGSHSFAISEEVLQNLKKQYGFDKPIHIRYWLWIKSIATLDFGESFIYEEPVINVIVSKFPVSLQFGIVSFILTYLVCIPLGIAKAIKEGSRFDFASTVTLLVMYSIPSLVLGILLKTYFTGGGFLNWFPVGDLYSDQYFDKNFFGRAGDRVHHFILPLICYMIGHFTVLTFLTKNSLLDEVRLDYVRTARAKGLNEKVIIYKHALRNALIPIVTGLGSFLGLFLAGSLIVEKIFTLDGIGLLSYNSLINRDYHLIMALIFIQAVLALFGRLISDFAYVLVDPRIDFT